MLAGSPARILVAVVAATQRETGELAAYVQTEKLHGQVLNQRTGNLARSITPEVTSTESQVTGTVGIPQLSTVPYAAIHEFGFQGTESVREFVRTQTHAWGKPITPREVTVQAHERQVSFPARSYLRTSLQERFEAIVAGISLAVEDVL